MSEMTGPAAPRSRLLLDRVNEWLTAYEQSCAPTVPPGAYNLLCEVAALLGGVSLAPPEPPEQNMHEDDPSRVEPSVPCVEQGDLPRRSQHAEVPAADDPVCEHGTAMDVHCCNCHSGFLFDIESCVCAFPDAVVEQIHDGEWVNPTPQEGHRMVCCDCGLVHSVDFRVEDGRAHFRPFRDEPSTQKWRAEHPDLPMRAAGGGIGPAWQPIASCPADVFVLLCGAGWKKATIGRRDGDWFYDEAGEAFYSDEEPTLWRPIPDLPAAPGGRGGAPEER